MMEENNRPMTSLMDELLIKPVLTPKNPLASRTIWGLSVLTILELAEIATGNPFSLNGAIKLFLWAAGSGLIAWGRWSAKRPLDFTADL